MRAPWPRGGGPWPHDMAIRVDDVPHAALTLLFVREAWRLAPDLVLPELDPVPSVGTSALPDVPSRAEWTARWRAMRERLWAWYERGPVDRPPRPDDPAWVQRATPPMWLAEYGVEGVDRPALTGWTRSLYEPLEAHLRKAQEHHSLDALVLAWRAGIDSIVVLPYRGYYVRRAGERTLVVSGTTRDDPELYGRALRSVL